MVLSFSSISLSLLFCEGVLRLKNRSMTNYDIEMWRYAKELKTPNQNPLLGHEHITSKSAVLQGVNIRLNRYGLRGKEIEMPSSGKRRILFLGSSITLGWGVPEEETLTSRLEKMLRESGEQVEVLNAGIGNYSAVRYVELFFARLRDLKPTDIVIHYFLRDAEHLEKGGGNWLLRNSELAVTLWNVGNRALQTKAQGVLEKHYNDAYQPNAKGFVEMKESLKKLSVHAEQNGVRLFLAMIPDIHNLTHYPYHSIHETMRRIATEDGIRFIDLYPALAGLTPAQIFSMPDDPHPNSFGHEKMAEALFPVLSQSRAWVTRS